MRREKGARALLTQEAQRRAELSQALDDTRTREASALRCVANTELELAALKEKMRESEQLRRERDEHAVAVTRLQGEHDMALRDLSGAKEQISLLQKEVSVETGRKLDAEKAAADLA